MTNSRIFCMNSGQQHKRTSKASSLVSYVLKLFQLSLTQGNLGHTKHLLRMEGITIVMIVDNSLTVGNIR